MGKKPQFDGLIAHREVDDYGYVHCFDKNDRACLDRENSQRVVLSKDMRRHAPGLFMGALGRTCLPIEDPYQGCKIEFDSGERLFVRRYDFQCVSEERAEAIAADELGRVRGTEFDADPQVAAAARAARIRELYAARIDYEQAQTFGVGPQELYAFTFPSLRELAELKGEAFYPVKIGYTADDLYGALARIHSAISEPAAYPERPALLLVWQTAQGRKLETAIHRHLRKAERRITTAVGHEWFSSNLAELLELCESYAR